MNITSLLLLACALSIDSLIVSATCGMQPSLKLRRGFLIAFVFAFFQSMFPLLGAFLGGIFQKHIERFDHWIAFGLLGIIGIKMLIDAWNIRKEEGKENDISRFIIILGLGIATSIDAFVLGIGLGIQIPHRSEERRVGKECRSRWSPYH